VSFNWLFLLRAQQNRAQPKIFRPCCSHLLHKWWSLPLSPMLYRRRRCILPVDGFFEWKAIKGQKAKQPFAIAMKDGKPLGIGGIWEN